MFLGPFALIGFVLWVVWPKGKRKISRSQEGIVAQYEPPEGITVAELGMLYDYKGGRLETMATLYALKLRGVLTLDRSGTGADVHMELLTYDPTQLAPYEDMLLRYFFKDSRQIVLQTEAGRSDFATLQSYFVYKLMQELQKKGYAFFEDGFETLPYGTYLEDLFKNPLKMIKTLAGQGAIGKKLTEKAKAIMPQIDGLALYIKTAEIDKIQFHIQGDINQFIEKMTPYAIVFDEMERWQIMDIPLVTTVTDPEVLRRQSELQQQGINPAIEQSQIIDSYQVKAQA